MKPPPFEYVRVRDLDGALDVLSRHGDEAKLVAGGQSLVPLLNLRLARPELLVDVNDLPLDGVVVSGERLRTEALVRHRALGDDSSVARSHPLLAHAATHIGHAAIRNRGTVGGSISHADPAAELSLVAVAGGAEVEIRSRSGARTVPAARFFQGSFMTDLQPEEMVVAVEWPVLGADDRWGFCEVAERAGDFASAAAAVVSRAGEVTVAVAGLRGQPVQLPDTGALLTSGETAAATVDEVVRAEVDDIADSGREPRQRRLVEHVVLTAVRQAVDSEGAS